MPETKGKYSPIPTLSFLKNGGEMGELIRKKDWASTVMGNMEHWPQSLITTLNIILHSKFPMFLFWGPRLICFYNNAYRPSLGNNGKHPFILGEKGEDAWPEIWHIIKPLIDQVLAGGEATWSQDQLIPIYRNGAIEDVYWTFSYSPAIDESGKPAGVLVTCTETTEKVKNLLLLEESNDQLQFAIEAAGLATWDYNPGTNKFTSNARLKEWFGLNNETETALGQAINLVADYDRVRVTAAIEKALDFASGGNIDIDFCITNAVSGNEMIVHTKGRAWFDEHRKAYRMNGILEDVTEQAKSRKKVEKSEQRFHAAVNAIKGILWTNNAAGEMEGKQPGWAALTGQTIDEYKGYGWVKAVHPDDAQPTIDAWNKAVAERKTFIFEHRLKVKDGSWGHFSIRAIPILNEDNSIKEWVGVHTDITEEKEQQQILFESEQKFRLLADSMPQFIWTGNAQGNLNYFNEAVYKYSGLTAEQINTDGWLQIVHPEDRDENIKAWLHSISTGQDFIFEHRFRRHDGEYQWQLSRAVAQKNAAGNIQMWVGTSTNIHEIKQMDEQKDFFINMASHELKTPLTTIKGYVELLQSYHQDSSDNLLITSLATINKQVLAVSRLISEMLDISKIKSGRLSYNKQDFEMNELVNEVVTEIQLIKPGQEITFCKTGDTLVHADRERIAQVMINFLNNAIKYSPGCNKVKLESIIKDDEVIISVEDFGIGISKKDKDRIFERFYRVEGKNEKRFPGFGIGLFVSSEIIQGHGGKIAVKSEPGKGSVFYFSLPLNNKG